MILRKSYYNGGGHENAAGGSSKLMKQKISMLKLIENFRNIVKVNNI